MNWHLLRKCAWIDTRAQFVSQTPAGGRLLDIGASDGETLNHFAELRPDLDFCATDIAGSPENYPVGTEFHRGDLEKETLPWPANFFDAVTCMHVVEHLRDHALLFSEVSRVLKPEGRIYFETPHPKTLKLPSAKGKFTLNFFDDPTHIEIVTVERLAELSSASGLRVVRRGVSRNLLFAGAYPFYFFRAPSRQRFTALTHWLGWSAFLIAQKPDEQFVRNKI